MKIGFAQINPTVGDLHGNFEKIIAAYDQLARAGADIVVAPELAVSGYPPQDLVFKSRFVPENLAVLDELQKRLSQPALLVGFVDRNEGRGKPFHNAAALLQTGEPLQKTHKSLLPTYDVFDEDHYCEPARQIAPLNFRGHRIGVTICEDIWTERYLPRPFYDVDPVRALVTQEAEMILNVSASPFSLRKPAVRREMICGLAGTYQRPIFYCNAVGGNDQLVFDGVSRPVQFSSRGSVLDALALAKNLEIQCLQIPIADAFAVFKAQFKEVFAGRTEDATEENMQARLRGMTLMALSNKFGHLVLSTGNKSELAVGYCTIYGDMAGGLAVISDVPKTMHY